MKSLLIKMRSGKGWHGSIRSKIIIFRQGNQIFFIFLRMAPEAMLGMNVKTRLFRFI